MKVIVLPLTALIVLAMGMTLAICAFTSRIFSTIASGAASTIVTLLVWQESAFLLRLITPRNPNNDQRKDDE
jgi:hypothetical protein